MLNLLYGGWLNELHVSIIVSDEINLIYNSLLGYVKCIRYILSRVQTIFIPQSTIVCRCTTYRRYRNLSPVDNRLKIIIFAIFGIWLDALKSRFQTEKFLHLYYSQRVDSDRDTYVTSSMTFKAKSSSAYIFRSSDWLSSSNFGKWSDISLLPARCIFPIYWRAFHAGECC